MPGPGGLVICNGYTPTPGLSATQAMNHDMAAMEMADMQASHLADHPSTDGNSPDHDGSTPCPYAATATAMAGTHAAVPVAVTYTGAPRIVLAPQPFVPRGTIVPTRLPRGPPSLA